MTTCVVAAQILEQQLASLENWEPGDKEALSNVAWAIDDLLDGDADDVERFVPALRLLVEAIEVAGMALPGAAEALKPSLVGLCKVVYRASVNSSHRRTGFKCAMALVREALDGASPLEEIGAQASVTAESEVVEPAEEAKALRAPVELAPSSSFVPADPPVLPFSLVPEEPDLELLVEFCTECGDLVEGAETSLLGLENDPSDVEAVNTVFRAFHTIKGTSAFLGIDSMAELSHRAETILSMVRDGKLSYGAHEANLSLRSIDLLKQLIEGLEEVLGGADAAKPADFDSLMYELKYLAEGEALAPSADPAPTPVAVPAAAIMASAPAPPVPAFRLLPDDPDLDMLAEFITEHGEIIESAEAALLELESKPAEREPIKEVFRAFHTVKGSAAFVGIDAMSRLAHRAETLLSGVREGQTPYGKTEANLSLRSVDMLKELLSCVEQTLAGNAPAKPAGYDELYRLLPSDEDKVADEVADEVPDALPAPAPPPKASAPAEAVAPAGSITRPSPAKAMKKTTVEQTVRVQTGRLDHLVDMVGELVIAQAILAQDETLALSDAPKLTQKTSHLSKIVRDLQGLSMSLRMVPIKATFKRMNRLVRDLTQKVGKQVQLTIDGEDTEIDRNMVDALGDPLVHMLRNSLDHGIEPPDERAAAGKPTLGTVHLSAGHQGGYIVVTMEDDGRGINRDIIVEKAISRGMIESDRGMADSDVFNLLFEPGFSTAAKVTDVSGRGVGMDVVRKNVESLHGRITIESTLGKGTKVSILLPITLAITDGMLVRVGSHRYIIPTASIVRSLQPTGKELHSVVGRGEMVVTREAMLPMFRLSRLFDIENAVEDPTKALLVEISDQDSHFGLLVDELLGQQQIVVKSLGGMGKTPGVSGGAILGDGQVGLILDVRALSSRARTIAAAQVEPESVNA